LHDVQHVCAFVFIATQCFTPFKNSIVKKTTNSKKQKQKPKKYDLDVFASLPTSFPINLKLKEKSTFNTSSY
jgi:hypothetical protein